MTAPIDPAGREAELQALADAATPGEWSEMCMGSEGYFVFEVAPSTGYKRRRRVAACTNESWEIDKANAAFIAASREAVPWLLDRLAELRAENEKLRIEDAELGRRLDVMRHSLSFLRAWRDGVTGRAMVYSDDVLAILNADANGAALDAVQPEGVER